MPVNLPAHILNANRDWHRYIKLALLHSRHVLCALLSNKCVRNIRDVTRFLQLGSRWIGIPLDADIFGRSYPFNL